MEGSKLSYYNTFVNQLEICIVHYLHPNTQIKNCTYKRLK